MAVLDFHFHNMKVSGAPQGPDLCRAVVEQPAYIVVEFPPQAVLEEAFPANNAPGASDFAQARLAGTSRLAFAVPSDLLTIPYQMDELLNLARLEPEILGPFHQGQPGSRQTAIEAPWDLILSPSSGSNWDNARSAVTHNGRTEIWRTRLTGNRNIRAVARRHPEVTVDPFAGVPIPREARDAIVTVSSGSSGGAHPATASRLDLSAMGASLAIDGEWDHPQLTEWRHRATFGRDNYVKVVTPGYLCPLGIPAAHAEITERKFVNGNAVLIKREFIMVNTTPKPYPAAGQPFQGRSGVIKTVQSVTETAEITTPTKFDGGMFWPQVNGGDVVFDILIDDWDAQQSGLRMRLLRADRLHGQPELDDLRHAWRRRCRPLQLGRPRRSSGSSTTRRRLRRATGGCCPSTPQEPGATTLNVFAANIGAETSAAGPGGGDAGHACPRRGPPAELLPDADQHERRGQRLSTPSPDPTASA